jgi:cytidylate kinase
MTDPPLVTMVGRYGAGLTRIGPRVADELGVPYLDRDIVTGVARRLGIPEEAVESYDPDVERKLRGPLRRFLDTLGDPATADTGPAADKESRRLRSAMAAYLAAATARGGVVVGRGAMVLLRNDPGVLHVRLDGPRKARIEQAMRMFDVDRRSAEQLQKQNDRARDEYVYDVYGVDARDPDLYHLRIDSTALPWDLCVELIVTAARARASRPAGTPQADAAEGEGAT